MTADADADAKRKQKNLREITRRSGALVRVSY